MRLSSIGALLLLAAAAWGQSMTGPGYGVSPSTGAPILGYPPSANENPGVKPKTPSAPKKKTSPGPDKAAPAQTKKKPAHKAAAGKPRKYAGPCSGDAERLCGKSRGRREVHVCLREHLSQLSEKCRAAATRSVDAACANERGLLCSGLPAGGDRLMRCLREHERDATTDCANALDDAAPSSAGAAQ